MAKVRFGTLAGQISGSIGSTVFSHGRGGAYVRQRSIPVTHTSIPAMQIKAWFSASSVHWATLGETVRLSWQEWAKANPYTDRLGEKRVLDGHAAYTMLCSRLLIMGGTYSTTPPVVPAPSALLTLGLAADIGAGTCGLVFTATPVPAATEMWVWAAVSDTASQKYVRNRLRLVAHYPAAAASPQLIKTEVEVRLGTLVVGQRLTVQVQMCSTANGLISLPIRADASVIST